MADAMVGTQVSRYMELVSAVPLRPIRSDEQYDRAVAAMDSLLGIDRDADEEDYLEVLGDPGGSAGDQQAELQSVQRVLRGAGRAVPGLIGGGAGIPEKSRFKFASGNDGNGAV